MCPPGTPPVPSDPVDDFSFAALHGYVLGLALIGSWFVVMVVALVLRVVRRDGDVPFFWRIVSIAQVLIAVQLLLGLGLFVAGGRPAATTFDTVFHMLYGAVFPGIVLFFGHKVARDGRMHPLSAFATVGLVNFGLTARSFMVAVAA